MNPVLFPNHIQEILDQVGGEILGDIFASFPGNGSSVANLPDWYEDLFSIELDGSSDEFELIQPSYQGTAGETPSSGGFLTATDAIVPTMAAGKPGDGGGSGGGGSKGGGKPSEPPAEPSVSENNPDQVLVDTGTAAELGASGGNFYFSSDGSERVGTTIDAISGFDIVLEYVGDWSSSLAQTWQTALEKSADFFTSFISEGLFVEADSNGTAMADSLINNGSVYWDDLWIQIDIGDIPTDGVLASAGPTTFWGAAAGTTSGWMPAAGSMSIDTDNTLTVDQATLIATHEMMHVLGVGTLWGQSNALLAPYNHDLVNNRGIYTGTAANSAYSAEFVSDAGRMPKLAVENNGGSGTAGGHWETDLAVSALNTPSEPNSSEFFSGDFAYELMTGWIDLSNPQTAYLSDTSLAVLEDLGYTVDWSVDYQYDNYTFDYGLTA